MAWQDDRERQIRAMPPNRWLTEHANFILRRLDEARLQSGWRPIETAPKDGAEILGWCSHLGRHIVSWGCQPQHNPHHFWISSTCRINHIEQPTHWMPLPEPPTE